MTTHLEEVSMTYVQHFLFSSALSIRLFFGSICALIHAVFPEMLITSTSDLSVKLNGLLHAKI